MPTLQEVKSLTITFLTPVSLGSLNGSDKEADNVSNIKKLTRGTKTYPYVSSQALRRALRDQLGVLLGPEKLSEGMAAKEKKGAAITKCLPAQYIDDDLFGFMDATKGGTHKRTSPVRVAPLLAIDPYEGDLDFGTNYMSVEAGGTPNIFETEIHGGLYRGTILIELDAVGRSRDGEGISADKPKQGWELKPAERAQRVGALLTALQHLWSSGRQSRYLADISPKFIAAAATTAKVPLFLESVRRAGADEDDGIDVESLHQTLADARAIIADHCFGARPGLFAQLPKDCKTVGEAFKVINGWVRDHYGV
jgi:CRISPR-associated protein Cst2